MGLTTFCGTKPTQKEIIIAKNYLTEAELKDLNLLVSGYLEFAERRARAHIPMCMKDWVDHLDAILTADGNKLLSGAGTISHDVAVIKATDEYDKYKDRIKKELSPVEEDFIENLKVLNEIVK
jgi:hypothetical protein